VSGALTLERTGRSVTVTGPGYRLEIRETQPFSAPYAELSDPDGLEWTEFSLLSSVSTIQSPDEVFFRSSIGFAGLLVPGPTEPVQFVRPARSSAVPGVVGDADPGRLHAIFSPPPLALGLSRAPADSPTHMPGPAVASWWNEPILCGWGETSWPDLRGWIADRHAAGQGWGIAALHRLLATLQSAALAAKPDALVITHAMHPSFAEVSGMIRLNDVSKRDLRGDRADLLLVAATWRRYRDAATR
jgi:hypothetical protein